MTDLRASVGPRAGGDLAAFATPAERGAARQQTAALLKGELTLDAALKIALLNAPKYQGLYARLNVAAAERSGSTQFANPLLIIGQEPTPAGVLGGFQIGLAATLIDLLSHAGRTTAAGGVYEAERLAVAADVVAAATDVRTAYVEAVAASHVRAVKQELDTAAHTAAALAQRFHAAGNIPLVRLREEQAAAADAALALSDAELAEARARESLALAMGVDAGGDWKIPAVLPDAMPTVAEGAVDRRLDVLAARAAAKAALGELKLRTGLRLWREINLEAVAESEGTGEWAIGRRLEIALPIFNQGKPQVATAAAAALKAEYAREAVEQSAASEVRISRVAFKQAEQRLERYRKEILPLHDEIVELKLKEYNYMLVGAFEVLTARQDSAHAQVGYVETLRDYWKARVALDSALGGGTPAGLIATEITP